MREECIKISENELIKQHNTMVSVKLKAFKITGKKEKGGRSLMMFDF